MDTNRKYSIKSRRWLSLTVHEQYIKTGMSSALEQITDMRVVTHKTMLHF